MFSFRSAALFLSAVFLSLAALAQGNASSDVTPEMRKQANEFYQKQDWRNSADAYQKILKSEDKNIGARYRYGMSLLNLNKNEEAKMQFENVFAASPNPIFALALAQAYARLSSKDKAYEVLEKSTMMGGIAPETLTAEKDFAFFKNEPRFQDLLKKSDMAVNPCKASDEFRQLDFWVGEWDAKNLQGVTVGSSSIQNILGQCVIFENWSTPVMSGKSFNIYNSKDKKWHQTWVDDKGTFVHYVGELIDGKMVYIAENIVNGKKILARMTFSKLPNGNVRQFGENSSDDGKTWTTSFDLNYSRKKI